MTFIQNESILPLYFRMERSWTNLLRYKTISVKVSPESTENVFRSTFSTENKSPFLNDMGLFFSVWYAIPKMTGIITLRQTDSNSKTYIDYIRVNTNLPQKVKMLLSYRSTAWKQMHLCNLKCFSTVAVKFAQTIKLIFFKETVSSWNETKKNVRKMVFR